MECGTSHGSWNSGRAQRQKVAADEQASRLALEKRDFTATYTLGATTRQITYY